MPIVVKDYEWEQSDTAIFVTVPLKGVVKKKVDILTTENYVKVNYPPYLFECFLFADVLDRESATEIGNGAVIFKLVKCEPSLWPSLQNPESDDKAVQKQLREAALQRYAERAEQQKKQISEMKHELGRFSVREQMKLEEEDRKRIENIKEQERKKAMEELEVWKEKQKLEALQAREELELAKQAAEESRKSAETNKEREVVALVKTAPTSAEGRKISETVPGTNGSEEPVDGNNKPRNRRQLNRNIFQEQAGEAPLREVGKINVTFTPRVFPTPTRESLAEQEDAWLAKQAEARRVIELEDKDLTDDERNPVWLRDKGNSFFQAGNYQAAVNAYTHAIRLDCKMPALYSNRAACHLKMNNLFKCIEDCTKALELLTPPVPQNAASRAKVHVRRGTAYCQLELYAEGLMDYEVALKLDPQNESLRTDAENIRQIVQGSSSSSTVHSTDT